MKLAEVTAKFEDPAGGQVRRTARFELHREGGQGPHAEGGNLLIKLIVDNRREYWFDGEHDTQGFGAKDRD